MDGDLTNNTPEEAKSHALAFIVALQSKELNDNDVVKAGADALFSSMSLTTPTFDQAQLAYSRIRRIATPPVPPK